MIDVHCHILPALDDGARDLDDSAAMAVQAAKDGIGVVCATPHIRSDHAVRIAELPSRLAALQRELRRREIDVLIASGAEIAQATAAGLNDTELCDLSLGGGGWVLIEPAPGPLGDELIVLVDGLSARGVNAIVAHPERHAATDFEERLRELIARGALIQWTADFVARAAAGDLVLEYASAGLVHLLGSDAHSSRAGRPVRLAAGVARLRDVCEERLLEARAARPGSDDSAEHRVTTAFTETAREPWRRKPPRILAV
ncbi:MAG: CpsB/CapC family capsule biosynthesis tyrosine phosphatase [Solirubrobacteraceae bacterium]